MGYFVIDKFTKVSSAWWPTKEKAEEDIKSRTYTRHKLISEEDKNEILKLRDRELPLLEETKPRPN